MALRFAVSTRVFAVVLLVTLYHGGRAEEPKDRRGDRVQIVRETFQQVPPTILQIKEPIRVTQCVQQNVPVVIGLLFTDADGTHHSFSWWLDQGKSQNREFDCIYWVRYRGPSPLGENTFRLPVRGPEEVALYGLLLRWVAAKEKARDRTLFEQTMLKDVSSLLEKLDDRFAGQKPAPQKW